MHKTEGHKQEKIKLFGQEMQHIKTHAIFFIYLLSGTFQYKNWNATYHYNIKTHLIDSKSAAEIKVQINLALKMKVKITASLNRPFCSYGVRWLLGVAWFAPRESESRFSNRSSSSPTVPLAETGERTDKYKIRTE